MIKMEDLSKKYNLKTVQTSLSKSPQNVARIAESFGYPVVLKIESPDIFHKSDIGAVKLNLKNKTEVLSAYDEIISSVNLRCPSAKIEGISVQEMMPEGFEVIIGYIYDKVFGPVLMAGIGGIFTEALKDISFRVLPITEDDAVSMITSLKSSDMLLKGFRYIKKIPIDMISNVIIKVSNLAMDNMSKVSSFDINPAIFYGSDYRIVDFKYIEKNDSTTLLHEEPNIENIDKFFNATSIAVIGASPVKDKLGYIILDNLKTNGYKGRLYPVNLKYNNILGLKSYPSIETIPDALELVIITISLADVPEILIQCSKKGTKNAIIISAGGKESGHASVEENIIKTAKKYKIRVMGCNCIGVYDACTKVDSMFFSYNNMSRPGIGDISLMSQSGTVGLTALDIMPSISKFASYGNRIDVDEADLVKYFSQDGNTKVISIYIEGLAKGRKFYDAVKGITHDIPVVVYKAGRSDLASKATMSHTGFLSGTHKMISDILSQAHVVQVDSFESLCASSRILSKYKRVKRNKTLIITNGAGVTIQAIDRIEAKKILSLTSLTENTETKLKQSLASHVSLANPVDLTGTATEVDFDIVLSSAVDDENVDIILVYAVLQCSPLTENMVEIIKKYADTKPIVFCAMGGTYTSYISELFEAQNIPVFKSVEELVSAAEALVG